MSAPDATRLARVRVMEVLGEEIGRAIENLYTTVARDPGRGFHFPTGPEAAGLVGYPEEALAQVPEEVLARFAGVGCPLAVEPAREGEAVLDVGSGAGTDLFMAAYQVGPGGRVVGVELTHEMQAIASDAAERAGLDHVTVLQQRAPRMEVPGDFDLVTSNGVINLIPDKEAVLARIHDLLRPGGRLVLSDVVLTHAPSIACLSDAELWAECLVGAYTEEAYLDALDRAGFQDVTVHERGDYFQHSSSAKTRETAEDLGAFAWTITARRAGGCMVKGPR